ncbi:HAD superfamily hydrolase (TIGR01509 family) [Nocardia transvalensis]|uniref:HAD superfamily hydrolase (TIGR01509 family) n=1 Tax=Nocardia transvalensis TaxID=37333 RepID=A0A7W9UGH0_9NOCA|nr:HAD family phosphatase [Nocardia transvalensis]MBB5912076.1 HAD superfamily hydrolase (TIGR01509 family) [Nocardia transvalensis]
MSGDGVNTMRIGGERPVRAVVFDMDGLLLDSERLAIESLISSGAELGYDLPLEFCRGMIGQPADRCRELAAAAYGDGFPVAEFFTRHEATLARFVDAGRLTVKPGVTELLDALDAQAIPRAIATSSGRERTDHHLRVAGIHGRFDAIVTRQDVARGKPHPEPYLTATAALGADPEHTLALEDSPNGLRAAHAAGLRCLLIPDLVSPTPETRTLAHRVYPDLYQAITYITTANTAPAAT